MHNDLMENWIFDISYIIELSELFLRLGSTQIQESSYSVITTKWRKKISLTMSITIPI